ncbi:MAG: AI-2E family transporter, partial [Desulfuromonadaceae bacterium]
SASTFIQLIQQATTGLFLPILLSLIVTFLLDPLVNLAERERLSRTPSIFVVYLLVTAVMFLIVTWFSPHWQEMWNSLRTDLPRYTAKLIALLREGQANLLHRFPYIESYDLPGRARTMAEQLLAQVLVETPKSALRLGSLLVLVPLFSFFFLRDGNRILRLCVALTPNRYFEMVHDLSYLVSRQMAHFIRGRLLEAFIVGVVVSLGLSLTDIRYAPLLGLFAGITNLVPYIGPIIGMVPGILIALVDLGTGGQFWWILVVYILISQVIVDNFILIPILISRVSNLHPLWVILAIIMGGKLYGVLGMIIGVPVVSTIKIALLEIRHYRSTFILPKASQELD